MARRATSAVMVASSLACVLLLSDGYGGCGSAGFSLGQSCNSSEGQAMGGTESVLLQVLHHQQVRSSSQSSGGTPGPCRESCSCWSSLADAVTCGARIHFVVGLSKAASAVQREFPSTCSCGVGGASSGEKAGPCQDSCACWRSLADNHTCEERIRFLADRHQEEPWNSMAATAVQQEHPDVCFCAEKEAAETEQKPLSPLRGGNVYKKEEGIGAWGGWCTCPNGQRYNVGDRHDACMHGPASLACEGGVPGDCKKEIDASREGMSVICAAAAVAATPAPTPTPPWSYRPDPPGWGWQS